MAKPDNTEDLDAMIDAAVDTVFVETTGEEELDSADSVEIGVTQFDAEEEAGADTGPPKGPSLTQAMDSLFRSSAPMPSRLPDMSPVNQISSGNPEMDMAIDAAVDTLFVEEPDTPAPETQQIDVEQIVSQPDEAAAHEAPATEPTYDDLMAGAIEQHMVDLFTGSEGGQPPPPPAEEPAGRQATPRPRSASAVESAPLAKLNEAILTLEWEISKKSVTALRRELESVRGQFHDNVTVDFAALSMRVVLDYVVKRMSRAHPESIRFLLDLTDLLDKGMASSRQDPLKAFHRILERYEQYKSIVRRAEGLPDQAPAILDELEIESPSRFSAVVEAHAMSLIKAAYSLTKRMEAGGDKKNLIRSFRFLVNRSVNQILNNTQRRRTGTKSGKRKTRRL